MRRNERETRAIRDGPDGPDRGAYHGDMKHARRPVVLGISFVMGGLALGVLPPDSLTSLAGSPGSHLSGGVAFAKDGPANPLPAILETCSVGAAIEFRQVILHPILLPAPPTEQDKKDGKAVARIERLPAPASSAPGGLLGLGDAPSDNRTKLAAKNLGDRSLLLHPGDLIRTDGGDFVMRNHEYVPAGKAAELRIVLASKEPEGEKTRPEPGFLMPIPGPALLWYLLTEPKERDLVEALHDLAKEVDLDTPRRSPAEFATAKKIAKRVAEYEKELAILPAGPSAARRVVCGYAVVVDGGFAGIEVFGDPESFAALWPGRLRGIAVEAAIQELEMDILTKDLAAPTDPDRFIAEVKQAMLGLYDLEVGSKKIDGFGRVVRFARKDDLGRAVIAEDGRAPHLVVVRDPAARKVVKDEDGDSPSPGPISRKARPTAFEKRWLDRRASRQPEVPGGGR